MFDVLYLTLNFNLKDSISSTGYLVAATPCNEHYSKSPFEQCKISDHITPALAKLHWLPVAARIQFKIALLTFKPIKTEQPVCLHELLQFRATVRHTPSSGHNILDDKVVRTEFSSRVFCHATPIIWNSLPRTITDDLSCSVSVVRRTCPVQSFVS